MRLPAILGLVGGYGFDLLSYIMSRPLTVSSIRVRKFLSDTHFESNAHATGFDAPVPLLEALEETLRYEFLEDNTDKPTYETE